MIKKSMLACFLIHKNIQDSSLLLIFSSEKLYIAMYAKEQKKKFIEICSDIIESELSQGLRIHKNIRKYLFLTSHNN